MKFHRVHWRASEFLYKKKTLLWYTHVTIFFFVILLLMVLLKQWFGLILTAVLFVVFISHSDVRPKTVDYKVDKNGITIGERKIMFADIKSFTLDQTHSQPLIILNLDYTFALPVTLIVKEEQLDEVFGLLLRAIPIENDFSLIRWLTHWLHY